MQKAAITCAVVIELSMLAGVCGSAFADPSEEALRFIAEPDAERHFRGTDEESFAKEALPKGVTALLAGYDWGSADGPLPKSFVGYAVDLNKDGKTEYFIENIKGGSGGPAFFVLAELDGAWRIILDFQGGFYIMPTREGWPPLVSYSRGGGGSYTKKQYSFEGQSYRATVLERYRRGKITREVLPKEKG
jgi:hypothetical protein